jgi:SAM-dependent methyltransferase
MEPGAIRAGYAPLAAAYAAELGDELAGKPLDRAFLDAYGERVRGRGEVLEVGCGPGQVAAYLGDRGVTVRGLDLSPEMIGEATRRYPAIRFEVGDFGALPDPDGSLAGVVAFYAIVHLPTAALAAAFRELARALAPGGLLAVAFHAGTAINHIEELWGCATALDFHFHPPDEVVAALAEAGLALEARLDRAPYPGVEHPSQRTYLLARR